MIARDRLQRHGPGLLVSVRSADEAIEAVNGGASIIDIKEPDHGPLGQASQSTWRAVRLVVPSTIAVSVALGELAEWSDEVRDYGGISFRKLGLAGSGLDWRERWAAIRDREPGQASWVAVAYADWSFVGAPDPTQILEAAIESADCSGILVDTWDKTKPGGLECNESWRAWVERARRAGRFVALAGGLDRERIERLAPLRPDLFAVRGAACEGRDRTGRVQADQVAELVQVIRSTRP